MNKIIYKLLCYLGLLFLSFLIIYQCKTFISFPTPDTIKLSYERVSSNDFERLGIDSESFNYLFDKDVEYKKIIVDRGKYLGFQAKFNNIEVTNEQIKSNYNSMIEKNDGYVYEYSDNSLKMSVKGKKSCILYLDSRSNEKSLYVYLKVKGL
jgi:hypothetical protein